MHFWTLCFRLGCFMLAVLSLFTACERNPEKIPGDTVHVQLKWVHQAQFAGFYLASEKGYFADENIQVSFLEGGKDVDVLTSLITGKAQFAVTSPELVLLQRQKYSAPVTAVAVIYRKSAVVYVTKADSGISGPDDFIGKTAAVIGTSESHSEFEYQFKALMKNRHVDIRQIDLVAYDPGYAKFYADQVDITAAYYTGGVVTIRNQGHRLNLIWPSDYGIHFYSDTIITTEGFIDKNADLVERFLRASLKGWREAIEYHTEAIEMTLKYARVKDRKLQSDMLSAMAPLVHTGKGHIGWMSGEVWRKMHRVLVDQYILDDTPMDLERVYTMRFLNTIYGKQSRK